MELNARRNRCVSEEGDFFEKMEMVKILREPISHDLPPLPSSESTEEDDNGASRRRINLYY